MEIKVKSIDLFKIFESDQSPVDYWKRNLNKFLTFAKVNSRYVGIVFEQKEGKMFASGFGEKISEKYLKKAVGFHLWKYMDVEKFYSEFSEDKYLRKVIERYWA